MRGIFYLVQCKNCTAKKSIENPKREVRHPITGEAGRCAARPDTATGSTIGRALRPNSVQSCGAPDMLADIAALMRPATGLGYDPRWQCAASCARAPAGTSFTLIH